MNFCLLLGFGYLLEDRDRPVFAVVPRGRTSRRRQAGSTAKVVTWASSLLVPDGLFVASDLMALDALAVLREHGLRVPGDVAVVGFDDSVAATQACPPLTTVRQPVEEMAKALTLTLLDRIGDPHAPITSRVFPRKLIPRAST